MSESKAIFWTNNKLVLIDQRVLPGEEVFLEYENLEGVFSAIRDMVTRGAPLIGFTALYGMVLWLQNQKEPTLEKFLEAGDYLKKARPTAVNLAYEICQASSLATKYINDNGSLIGFRDELLEFTNDQIEKIRVNNLSMAKTAEDVLTAKYGTEKKFTIMTLCNTGWLACGPHGTALGVISYLNKQNRIKHVFASETRPYLQGGRLTAYELSKEKIPYEISVEGAFSYIMKNHDIDAIFIGADRIVQNGDTANKVGSSTLSIVAKHYNVPFYVVAPISSFDFETNDGSAIEIEMRPEDEVLYCQKNRIAPLNAKAINPSFDVTDHSLITGIISEKGIIKNPNKLKMQELWK